MMIHSKRLYRCFIITIYLLVFEFALMNIVEQFKYIDELYAMLFVPLALLRMKRLKKADILIIVTNLIYITIGIISNILYQYQVIQGIISDALLNVKFIFGIYTTYLLFYKLDINHYRRRIKKHVQIIVFVLFILMIADEFFCFYPCNEIRYGLRSEQLFFGHPTGLASVSFFLLLLLICFYDKTRKEKVYVVMGCMLLVSTLRAKAIVAFFVFISLFFRIIIQKKRLRTWQIITLSLVALILTWNQLYGYFFSAAKMNMARGALLYRSFNIARDHFPIGAGLGTYASAPSGDYYSILYSIYGLSNIYGLTREMSVLVSDVFWPMILGQTGYLGLLVYLFLITLIVKKIAKSYKCDKRLYLIGLGAIGYLLVSSISESAFVNPLSIPLSFIIGMVFINIEYKNSSHMAFYNAFGRQ